MHDQLFTRRSRELFTRAKRFLPGGVTGDGRASSPYPILFERARGKWLTDVDGNRYLDYHGGFGTAILGYAHPKVDEAVQKAMDSVGAFVGVPNPYEGELAERLCGLIPGIERVAFTGGGGSDAVYHCVRLARASTGRKKIIKFEGGYQGWHSDVAISTRPPIQGEDYLGRPNPVPASAGILPAVVEQVLVVTINDLEALQATFDEHGPEIAGMIVEPVVYSSGCVLVDTDFLQLARDLCSRHGTVLIFDEVMSGFRNGLAGAGARAGVTPDLGAYGKAVANGYILSFLGGHESLMTQLSPEGAVFYSGTFNGHPLSIAAAQATLDVIEHERVPERISTVADAIGAGVNQTIEQLRLNAVCQSYGSIWNLYFNARSIRNYRELAASITPEVEQMNDGFRGYMKDNGIYIHKRHVNRCFVSSQHDTQDVERTVALVSDFLHTNAERLAA